VIRMTGSSTEVRRRTRFVGHERSFDFHTRIVENLDIRQLTLENDF
jgi:hypothetical protein